MSTDRDLWPTSEQIAADAATFLPQATVFAHYCDLCEDALTSCESAQGKLCVICKFHWTTEDLAEAAEHEAAMEAV